MPIAPRQRTLAAARRALLEANGRAIARDAVIKFLAMPEGEHPPEYRAALRTIKERLAANLAKMG